VTLDELDRLLAKATPLPWRGDRYDGTVKYELAGPGRDHELDATDDPAIVLIVNHKNGEYGILGPRGDANETLIISGMNALPALLAVARAASQLLYLHAEGLGESEGVGHACSALRAALADLEAL